MAVSGNSIALKSFQSFTINEGLLAKVVEAVKAGEKEARTSGDVKSFEVFYKGFRQNISIGRIYIVPAKVCDVRNNFPIALLYGTVVRTLNLGEETADLITNKIGDTEFDEYSRADYTAIKEKLFMGDDGKSTSLVIFAPNWTNIREYIGFKYVSDDEKLSNLLRHLVFSAYFNPAVSSAFDALMTTVDTHKLDITDITPKMTYPFLSENPLRQFPDLSKQGGWTKPKIFLTKKTADAITKEVLDPQELNVFEALDSALSEATLPKTTDPEELADFESPNTTTGQVEIPEVKAEATVTAADGTELRHRPDYGEKGSYTQEMNVENSKTADTADNPANEKGGQGAIEVKTNHEKPVTAAEVAAAPFETPFTNVGPGTSAHDHADKSIAVKVDTVSQKGNVDANSPIGIAIDETGVPRRPEEERKAASIASEIMRDLDDGYVAMSTKSKAARAKREAELDKIAGRIRKRADVALTEESIWADITEDFGAAPVVELPGEGSNDSKSTDSLPEAMTSDKPEEAKAVTEAEIDKAEPKGPKSKMFQDKTKPVEEKKEEEPKAEEKDEPKEEPKEASAKTALLYMNDYDIDQAQHRFANDPILGPAATFLKEFKDEVDNHSDGWAHWKAPVQAAAQLMTLLQAGEANFRNQHGEGREGDRQEITVQSLTKAIAPIKAFMTRRGLAAGMMMPKLVVKKASKRANEVQPDVAEAKSEVVSPDTVDTDIKQPTKSVEEAAKVGTVGAQPVKVVNPEAKEAAVDQYPGEHGCRTFVGKTDTQGRVIGEGHVCMKPETIKIDGRMYCDEHRPDKKKKAADVSGDVSEAKSEVVSPDTVDADIKQPTESVEEAAKVAADEVYSPETLELAQRLINSGDDIAYDVAANSGQIFGNVKHMQWFIDAVANEIAGEETTVREYLDNKEANEAEEIMSDNPEEEHEEHFAHIANLLKKKADAWYRRLVEAFGSPQKAGKWMSTPNPEFGGKTPMAVLEENNLDISVLEPFLTRMEHGVDYDANVTAAAGDDHDESVEMSLGFGDLADLAVNLGATGDDREAEYDPTKSSLPSGDTLPSEGTAIITAAVTKTAEALYTDRNFRSKKDLKEAVARGEQIGVYDPGGGMSGEYPGGPPVNGRAAVAGPHYPEPHRWYAEIVLKDGVIVGVK